MNALINSQSEEIRGYEIGFYERQGLVVSKEGKTSKEIVKELGALSADPFPIVTEQYTGQEGDAERQKIYAHKPDILLTNYMMLELIMTRGGEDELALRKAILDNIQFLVFDELHTYRGRQGADVSMLIRRIKAATPPHHKVCCIGTSATMVSAETTSLREQREEVAGVASKIFASSFSSDQIISEFLTTSLGQELPNANTLHDCLLQPVAISDDEALFAHLPTAIWLEQCIAVEQREDRLVRRKPRTIGEIGRELANVTKVDITQAEQHLNHVLAWANYLNNLPGKRQTYLPFRFHQFIAQTGSVYATLGDRSSRAMRLEAGLYADQQRKLFPMVFSRESSHETYSVLLHEEGKILTPREPFDPRFIWRA